jgi:hypothetical protein
MRRFPVKTITKIAYTINFTLILPAIFSFIKCSFLDNQKKRAPAITHGCPFPVFNRTRDIQINDSEQHLHPSEHECLQPDAEYTQEALLLHWPLQTQPQS